MLAGLVVMKAAGVADNFVFRRLCARLQFAWGDAEPAICGCNRSSEQTVEQRRQKDRGIEGLNGLCRRATRPTRQVDAAPILLK